MWWTGQNVWISYSLSTCSFLSLCICGKFPHLNICGKCSELVLEKKWKQDSLHFFSRIICGSLGVTGPSEMVLSETRQFLITSLVCCCYQKGLRGGFCPEVRIMKQKKRVCALWQLRWEHIYYVLYFLSRWTLEYSSKYLFCCVIISVLCKALPTGKHILCTRDWVSHCFPVHYSWKWLHFFATNNWKIDREACSFWS